jgi:hypothetical protein
MEEIILNKKVFKKFDENYYISSDGQVYSLYSKKILKWNYDCDGYPRVDIHGKHKKIHLLVYKVWVGNIPEGQQVNHIDDDKNNPSVDNLYIGTQKDNKRDCINNGHCVANTYYITVFDKDIGKVLTFCPANKFIEYSGHSNKNGSIKKFFNKNWFKKRYEVIEYKNISNFDMLKSVTTMADECKPVE